MDADRTLAALPACVLNDLFLMKRMSELVGPICSMPNTRRYHSPRETRHPFVVILLGNGSASYPHFSGNGVFQIDLWHHPAEIVSALTAYQKRANGLV